MPEEMAEITTWGINTPTNSDTVVRMPLISVGPNESMWYPPMVNSPATTSTHAAVSPEEGPTLLAGVAGGATGGAAWGAVAFAVALGPAFVMFVAFVTFVVFVVFVVLPEPEAFDEALPDPDEDFVATVAFVLAFVLPAAAERLLPADSLSIESASLAVTGTRMCRRAVSSRSETWERAPCLASAVTKKASARKTARILK